MAFLQNHFYGMSCVRERIGALKLERAGSPGPTLSSSIGGEEEKSPYARNCITSQFSMLDVTPTGNKRKVNVFYEPFLS